MSIFNSLFLASYYTNTIRNVIYYTIGKDNDIFNKNGKSE